MSLALAVLVVTGKGSGVVPASQDVRSQAAEVSGSLTLSPASGDYSFSSTQTFPVGIIVDSAGKSVDGVDVILNFDPRMVQVIGSAIAPTGMFEKVVQNSVDNKSGQVKFSALTFSPKPETGILATFQIKPLTAGVANFNFDFTLGKTTDSNIAEHATARDILGKVGNGSYNFR